MVPRATAAYGWQLKTLEKPKIESFLIQDFPFIAQFANNVKATLTWFLWNMELLNIQLQKMNVDHLLNNPYVNEGTLREQNLY